MKYDIWISWIVAFVGLFYPKPVSASSYMFFFCDGKVIFCTGEKKKNTKRNNRNLFVPLSDSDCCCWCWGYFTEQQCRFPYLAENMDSSSTTTRGSKHSTRAGLWAAGWSKCRPGYRLCSLLLATQLRILPSNDLPASRSPEAFTAAELRPHLAFTRSLRPRVIPLYRQTVRGPRYALREARHVCLRGWSPKGTMEKLSRGPSDMLD